MSLRPMVPLTAVVALAALAPHRAVAQQASVAVTAAFARVHDPWPAPGAVWQGRLLGGAANLRIWWLNLATAYAEGELHRSGSPPWTLVDGEAFAGLQPVRWAGVSVGPHARTYVTPYGRFRRVLWEGRVRLDATLAGRAASGFLELRRPVSSRLNTSESLSAAVAGAAGLVLSPPSVPFELRLAYRFEKGDIGLAPRRESTEQLLVGIALGSRSR